MKIKNPKIALSVGATCLLLATFYVLLIILGASVPRAAIGSVVCSFVVVFQFYRISKK